MLVVFMVNTVFNNFCGKVDFVFTCVIKKFCEKISFWIFKKYDGSHINNSDVIVILIGKDDSNGAISAPLPNSFKIHNQERMKIVYQQVSVIEDIDSIFNKMKAQNNRIKGLWGNMHAYSGGLAFSQACVLKNYQTMPEGQPVGRGNVDQLKEALQKLDEQAVIVLLGCETGRVDDQGNTCIAQTLASLAPGRTVIAPIEDVDGLGFNLEWKNDSLDVTFKAPKTTRKKGIRGILKNLFYEMRFTLSLGKYGKNITGRFLCDKRVRQMTKAQP
jgi:hypothetical protein